MEIERRSPERRRDIVRQAARSTWQLDYAGLNWRGALRCLAGIAIPLLLGIKYHQPINGLFAASGALSAGFGSFQRVRRSCVLPMIMASIGISISTFTGTFLGHTALGFMLVAGLWGLACGLMTSLSPGVWWIGLQCAVYAIIGSHYPLDLNPSLTRGGLMLAGGLLQALLISTIWGAEQAATRRPFGCDEAATETERDTGPATGQRSFLAAIKASSHELHLNLSTHTAVGRESVRLALALAVAAGLSRWMEGLHISNSYWLPMTAAIVLKSDLHQTVERSLSRMAGTLVGVVLATLLAAKLHPDPLTLTALVVGFAGLCYTLLRFNYALYAVCITSYVVFLLAFAGLPEVGVIHARAICTVLGGALALGAHLAWPAVGMQDAGDRMQDGAAVKGP